MASPVEPVSNQGKSRIAGLVLACIVLLLMGLVNLPFQYVDSRGEWIGAVELQEAFSFRHLQEMPTMAGWPLNYWVQYQREDLIEDRFWSTSRLAFDLCVAVVCSLIVYALMQLRDRYAGATGNRRGAAIFDVGIALTILLVPGSLIAWQHHIASQHRQLSERLAGSANCYVSCWLPEPIVDHVPSHLTRWLVRLREIHILSPDKHQVESVAAVPTVVTLNFYGGDYDSSVIERLAGHVHFSSLRLSQRTLSESDLDAIASLPWLEHLSLSRTNLDRQLLRRLDSLPLRSVDLTHTPLKLSELGSPGWSKTLQEAKLSRPLKGSTDSLDIDGWPKLSRLRVSRFSTRLNAAPLKIRLANLPSLEALQLDRFQKHHLVLQNIPRLAAIDEGLIDVTARYVYEDFYPAQTWLTGLDLDGVASLKTIGCFARDLESISIRNAPNLRSLRLASYLVSSLGEMIPQPASADRCQEWIDHLGEKEGPTTVHFSCLPLSESDLSPLVNNPRIRHLRFDQSGISFEQIKKLEGMEQLESLDIRSCRLEDDELSWFLERFPNLADIAIDGSSLTRFDLTGRKQLKQIETSVLANVQDIQIVDLPSLRAHIRISSAPQQMQIRNAPSLLGLAVETPWPKHARIEGLRDLEWFAGGGKSLDDGLMDQILQCESLDQLTLAYASVTRPRLVQIGQLKQLSLLSLPGADVDDEVTSNWHSLQSLWEINLDDTSVSVETIAWLSQIESLRRVSLNRVQLNEAAADALATMRQVSELHLAGVSIDALMLRPLLQGDDLESLNLSGWSVDSELVSALEAAQTLRHLILRNCEIDARLLERIVASNPALYVDLGDVSRSVSDGLASELRRRAVEFRRGFSGWREALDSRAQSDPVVTAEQKQLEQRSTRRVPSMTSYRSGRIDPQLFRPNQLAN